MENLTTTTETSKAGKGISPSYTVRQFANVISKLKKLEMLEKKDEEKLNEIGKKIMEKFIGLDMFGGK